MTADIKITNIADILSATKGSPMERILHYLIYQDFPEFPEESALDEGSKAIGALNLPEKAIFATRIEFVEKVNELIDTHNKIGAELTPENSELGKEKLSKLSVEIKTLSKICEDLESLLWTGVKHRLTCEGISYTANHLSTTLDYLIVSSAKEEYEDDFFRRMGVLGTLFGSNGFSAEAHDCETCPVYDDCPLPMKKPR